MPKPLWKCPKCGHKFVTRNIAHSCGRYTYAQIFARSDPHVRGLFSKFASMVRACGPVTIYPQKSRIVCTTRVRFAGAIPHKSYLEIGFASRRPIRDPRIARMINPAPKWYVHYIPVHSEAQLDAKLQRWLRAAYRIGQQK